MRGFFAGSTLISERPTTGLLPKCGACGYYRTCQTPKIAYTGKGARRILIVGEFPDAEEDAAGQYGVGKSGRYLQEVLNELGVELLEDCWLTHALICHPENVGKINQRSIEYCRPNLLSTLRELKPHTVILMGGYAVQSLISEVWKDSPGPVTRWAGFTIPCQKPNVWICPTYSPWFLFRENNEIYHQLFKEHLRAAVAKEGRPWKEVPDYMSMIDVVLDVDEAARILRRMTAKGGVIAFDYENTCLKPETPGGEIVCASACWQGRKTIAYPWHGEAIIATREMLHADNCQHIAANLKHEDRWTRFDSGKPVRHWIWDTMLAAHTLDNRQGICGLKFQAFVQLGAESYDEHIKPFLKQKAGKTTNLVKDEVDLRQLLGYCGADTLLEYMLAEVQVSHMVEMFGDSGPRPHIPSSQLHLPNLAPGFVR